MTPRVPRGPAPAAFLLGAVLAFPALFGACSPGYVLRAGWEELKILERRRPLREAVHDTTLSSELRGKLRLVQDARAFADRELGLDPGDSFTSFAAVESDTLLLVVSAAYPYRLEWKTWWFPIVGEVPYRGYFDFQGALRAEERLRRRGFDTWVRPTAAFSTLGWLPDPLLSTALRGDSVSVVETVVHEITHTTFFPAGEANFNESFATFVGHRGAIAFFCDALRREEPCERARDRWHDTRVFGAFYRELLEDFRELYGRPLPDSALARRKRTLFREAAARYDEEVRPRLRVGRYGRLDPEGLNNAWLLSRVLYYTRLDDFERLYRGHGNLREAAAALIREARGGEGDPWSALDRLLAEG